MKGLLFIIFAFISTSWALQAQNKSERSENEFDQIIIKYKSELSEISKDNRAKIDSVVALRAFELAELYENYPATEAGQKGLVLAFRGWLNVDSVKTMGEYMNRVSVNDDIWSELMTWYSYGLQNIDADPFKYFNGLQSTLDNEGVTNPFSLTLIHSELGKFESMINDNGQKAIYHYEEVIDIGVDSVEVELAKRDLYDLRSLQIGNQVPDFKSKDLEGNVVDIRDYRGKFVFIEFWATWCGPCIPEVPFLKKAYERFGDRADFKMIGVSLDTNKETLEMFLEENEIEWTQILDSGGKGKWTGKLGTLFAVGNGIPKSFLIDKEGNIIATELRKERLSEVLAEYLK